MVAHSSGGWGAGCLAIHNTGLSKLEGLTTEGQSNCAVAVQAEERWR